MDKGALFRRFVAGRRVRCPVCRYDLMDAPEPRCPECGEALELYVHHAVVAHHVRVGTLGCLLVPVLFAGLFLWLEYTDPVHRRRPMRVYWGWGVAIGCTLAAAVIARAMAVVKRRGTLLRRSGSPDEECRIIQEITRSQGLECLVRAAPVGEAGCRACPACGDRLSVRIRPESPLSLLDRRSRWIIGALAMFGLTALLEAAGLALAVRIWMTDAGRAQVPVAPLWSSVVFWIAALGVSFNMGAMVLIWHRRGGLMRTAGWASMRWPVAASFAMWVQFALLYLLLRR